MANIFMVEALTMIMDILILTLMELEEGKRSRRVIRRRLGAH